MLLSGSIYFSSTLLLFQTFVHRNGALYRNQRPLPHFGTKSGANRLDPSGGCFINIGVIRLNTSSVFHAVISNSHQYNVYHIECKNDFLQGT